MKQWRTLSAGLRVMADALVRHRRAACACFFVLVGLVPSFAAEQESSKTYYVATDGKPDGDGSREKPWPTVAHALAQIGGGNAIIVRPGTYGPFSVSKQYAGTEKHPTVIRSEAKWRAVVTGGPRSTHGIYVLEDCHWVVIDGFEVHGGHDGIKLAGDYCTARHCWVHNNRHMGIASHHRKGGVIESNLIEFNGMHIQFDHGIYVSGDHLTIQGNIIRHNASYGIQLWAEGFSIYGPCRRRQGKMNNMGWPDQH